MHFRGMSQISMGPEHLCGDSIKHIKLQTAPDLSEDIVRYQRGSSPLFTLFRSPFYPFGPPCFVSRFVPTPSSLLCTLVILDQARLSTGHLAEVAALVYLHSRHVSHQIVLVVFQPMVIPCLTDPLINPQDSSTKLPFAKMRRGSKGVATSETTPKSPNFIHRP